MGRRTLAAFERETIAGRASRAVEELIRDAWGLGIDVSCGEGSATVIDCGVHAPGSWEAGRRVVEIAHGGTAAASIGLTDVGGWILPEVTVESWRPALSAYGLLVSLPLEEVDPAIRISGPVVARCADGRVSVDRAANADESAWGIGVLESNSLPGSEVVAALSRRSGLDPRELTLLVVPAGSVAGATQIAGRVNECVLIALEESLGIDCAVVTHVLGSAPIAPDTSGAARNSVTPDDLIHYAGYVFLRFDEGFGQDLETLAERLTFGSTDAVGKRFGDLLDEAGGVFEAIPDVAELSRPASVTLTGGAKCALVKAGAGDEALLAKWMSEASGRDGAR